MELLSQGKAGRVGGPTRRTGCAHQQEAFIVKTMHDLDDRLIRLLQADGRASFSELSKQLGVTRSAATAKVNELISTGELRIVAAIHPRLLGLTAVAHVSIQLNGSAQAAL